MTSRGANRLRYVPNTELLGFHPGADLLSELGEVFRGTMFFVKGCAVVVGFIQQNLVRSLRIKTDIELVAPGLFLQ